MLTRRAMTAGMLFMGLTPKASFAQIQPFRLRVVRDEPLADVLALNDCIMGSLYLATDFEMHDPGTTIASTLELPFRSNDNTISAIPVGKYAGFVREDGPLGWRVEFKGTKPRHNIEIHPGNKPGDIEGCILVGKSAQKAACYVQDSRATRDQIRELYGDNNGREIEISVEQS